MLIAIHMVKCTRYCARMGAVGAGPGGPHLRHWRAAAHHCRFRLGWLLTSVTGTAGGAGGNISRGSGPGAAAASEAERR